VIKARMRRDAPAEGNNSSSRSSSGSSSSNSNSSSSAAGSRRVASALKEVSLSVDREVAVKLLHPGVQALVETDLMILHSLSALCEWCMPSVARTVSLLEHVSEFSRLMRDQLNMTVEGENLLQFRENFGLPTHSERGSDHEHDLTIGFPCPILATPDLLVEDFVQGWTLSEVLKQCDVETRKRMAAIGIHAVFKMVFVDNYVHADLHPGNILVSVDMSQSPTKLKLSFIDTGLVVQLQRADARNFVDLFRAVITNDGYTAGQLMIERSRGQVPVLDKEQFSQEIQELVSNVHRSGFTLRELGLSDILQKVLHLCYKHQVKLESRFASIIVAIGIIEGVGRELDPDIDILKMAVPYVVRGAVKSLMFDFKQPKSRAVKS
jgi:aarF domain-containing kinase